MPDEQRIVIGGVDTHRDAHTAAAIDSAGRLLDTASFPATRSGYEQLLGWLRGLGGVERVGVEGTSSYGAGLPRHLAAENVTVIEVLRPKRRARRGHKSALRVYVGLRLLSRVKFLAQFRAGSV